MIKLRVLRWEISLDYTNGLNIIILIGRRVRVREGKVMKEVEVRVRSLLEGAGDQGMQQPPEAKNRFFS